MSPLGRPRARVAAWLGPIRVRLAAVILVAAVPLLLLASTIVWQNYNLALEDSTEHVARLRESAVARHAAAIDGADQMLTALAQTPELLSDEPPACHSRLAGIWTLQRARYTNLILFDAAGHVRCVARALPPSRTLEAVEARNSSLLAATRDAPDGFAVGPVRIGDFASNRVIPVAVPIRQNGGIAGYIYAGLRMDWFNGTQGGAVPALTEVWLMDPTRTLTPVATAGAGSLPPAAVLFPLLRGADIVRSRSAEGTPTVYASSPLPGGYEMLVGYANGADIRAARAILLRRAAQLAIFLLLGLAAVAVGTNRALVSPLRQLTDAVRRWRDGAAFDPAIATPPREIAELAASFQDAIAALAAQRTQLREAIDKQDLLMKEIHHRVKNNLQIVASLLNLQASRIRVPAARAEFAAARDRVRALATLHRHLYSHGELTTIGMRDFLTELCGQVFDAMGERQNSRITLTIEATDLQMNGDQAVPLSLVVTEAVSNAVKYAFPGGRIGQVAVRLTREGDHARLVISDDGIGLEEGRTETETGTRDGLGLQLIKGFSKQLGGVLTVHQEHGTCYDLLIPLQPVPEAPAEIAA